MYVRIMQGRFNQATYEDVLRLTREELIPAAHHLPGFRSYQLGVDRQAGRLVVLTAFDTAEQAQGMSGRRAPFEAVGVEFDAPDIYDVVAQA